MPVPMTAPPPLGGTASMTCSTQSAVVGSARRERRAALRARWREEVGVEMSELECPAYLGCHSADDAKRAAVRADPFGCGSQRAERQGVEECRIGEVDDDFLRLLLDRRVERCAQPLEGRRIAFAADSEHHAVADCVLFRVEGSRFLSQSFLLRIHGGPRLPPAPPAMTESQV